MTALAHYVTDKVKNMCRKICLGMCASVNDCGKGSVSEISLLYINVHREAWAGQWAGEGA